MAQSNNAEAEVDQIMLRIRAELGQRAPNPPDLRKKSAPSSILKLPSDHLTPPAHLKRAESIPLPKPIQLEWSENDGNVAQSTFEPTMGKRYHIEELFEYQDRDFVHAAYWALLKREPDEGGLNTYLTLLRKGASKTDILEFLRDSPEGRFTKATVAGLAARTRLRKLYRWPILGPLSRIAAAWWNLPADQRAQRLVQGALISMIETNGIRANEALRVVNSGLRDIEAAHNQLSTFAASRVGNDTVRRIEASIETVTDSVKDLRKRNDGKATIEEVRQGLGEVSAGREHLLRLLETKVERGDLAALASTLDDSRDDLRKLKAESCGFAENIGVLRAEAKQVAAHIEKSKLDMTGMEEAQRQLAGALERTAAHTQLRAFEATMRQSLNDVLGQVRQLKGEYRSVAERMAIMRSEGMYFSAHVEKSNAVIARIDQAWQLLTRSLEAKADRSELESLEKSTMGSIDGVSGDLRKLKEQGVLLSEQVPVLCTKITSFSTHAENIKTDIARLLETHQLIARSLETKAECHELTKLRDHILDVEKSRPTKEELAESNSNLEGKLVGAIHMISQLSEAKVDRAEIETYKENNKTILETMRIKSEENLRAEIGAVNARTRDVKLNLIDQERRLSLLLEEARKRLPEPISVPQIETMLAEEDHLLDAMYAEFEDIFRGTRADIAQRQGIYLPLVREATRGELSSPIVDIGCGRGEWLELLRDSGFRAQGVDTNRVFLKRCRDLNLDVVESDAVAFLRAVKRHSLGAVTSFHLIEHLPHKTLIAMLDASFRALRSGGVIILETPNPRNLQVASCNFYMDPTHRNPLPPELMKFVMEARGFVSVEIKELHPYSAENRAAEGPESINNILNRFLFSAQDYAVIGRKL